MPSSPKGRPAAIVTGASRRVGLGAAIALALTDSGWDVALTFWSRYDAAQPWGADAAGPKETLAAIEGAGGRGMALELDLTEPGAAARLFDQVESSLGPILGLVLNPGVLMVPPLGCDGVPYGEGRTEV